MSSVWTHWTREIAKRLSEVTGVDVSPDEIVVPPDRALGDFAWGAFRLAKVRKTSPATLAKEIAEKISVDRTDWSSVAAAGPYVNFTLIVGDAVNRVVREIELSGTRNAERGTSEHQLVLEYAQPNTHKEIHVGHLRNLALGLALDRILTHAGWHVVPVSYHGDVGAHVAKCLWYINKVESRKSKVESQNLAPSTLHFTKDERTGAFLGQMYAEASKELEAHPEYKDEVSVVQQKLEAHDPEWDKLWQETRRWSLDEMANIFDTLQVRIERQYLESEVVERGQQMVDELIEKGIAKESQGAIIIDLEEKKLGVFLVRKSDGTSLYATKDLALAELKLKEYPKTSRSLILVDNRQSLYFKQLFTTLEMMNIKPVPAFIGYEFVTLKSGAMSSREGNIVTFESFFDEVMAYARKEILSRHEDWVVGQVEHTAWAIAMGGIKFGMLKQDSDKIFTFELEQALAFDGATGPYCQYAATRLGSIIRKGGPTNPFNTEQELTALFDHASEKALVLALALFPEKVAAAADELRPAILAQWCLDTAQRVNDFYRDVSVLESSGELREGRLRLAAAARTSLVKGLELLGIPVPEEM